jgi:hypothetical protein
MALHSPESIRWPARFEPLKRHEVDWSDTVDVLTTLARLSTSSAHLLLEPDAAVRGHQAMSDDFARHDRLDLAYKTLVLSARQR